MVKIAFWDNCLCERGTTMSLFYYAYYNIHILGNESIIMYNTTRCENNDAVIQRFKNHFEVIGVDNFDKVDPILQDNKCDIFYITKAGGNEGQVSKVCKTVVHCVFNYSQPHGDVYAGISYWIKDNHQNFPVVPYMVDLPDTDNNMRKELNIPENSVVFGRYGGWGQFDIGYVHDIVYKVAQKNPNIYFLFANTRPFCAELPNIIHLGQIIDLNKKVEFINTCNAMLWARSDGETFGLAIAEFSIKNKPVIATKVGDEAHIHLLGEKGIWYDQYDLYNILVNFDRNEMAKKDWNAYRDYTPDKVMQIFKKVFID